MRYSEYWDEPWVWEPKELAHTLQPMLAGLERYDAVRVRLEREGGDAAVLTELNDALNVPIRWLGGYGGHTETRLASPRDVARSLSYLSPDLRFEVRMHPLSKLPVFYLARTRSDYQTNYDLVLEDYFVSQGYPLADERYVHLTRGGKNLIHLRMSQFREPLGKAQAGCTANSTAIDEQLFSVGHCVLSAAWHEDQHAAFSLVGWLQLDELRKAIEVLYLALTCDLCELRNSLPELPESFFRGVYPQSAIEGLLERLPALSGEALSELPRLALRRYAQLSKGLSLILRHQVGHRKAAMPLVKLMLANYTRLDSLRGAVVEDEALQQMCQRLCQQASEVCSEFGQFEPASRMTPS